MSANTEGRREIVGLHIGPSEAEPFWSFFLKGLLRRGLTGVKLVVSGAHEGLKAAELWWSNCPRKPYPDPEAILLEQNDGW